MENENNENNENIPVANEINNNTITVLPIVFNRSSIRSLDLIEIGADINYSGIYNYQNNRIIRIKVCTIVSIIISCIFILTVILFLIIYFTT
jgi:hypothetical protein